MTPVYPYRHIQCMNFSTARQVQCMKSIIIG